MKSRSEKSRGYGTLCNVHQPLESVKRLCIDAVDSSSSSSPQAPKDYPYQRLCSLWEADEFIKGCPEIQSLVVRVEGRTAEPQVDVRLFLIVAQAAHGFFRSTDRVLPAS